MSRLQVNAKKLTGRLTGKGSGREADGSRRQQEGHALQAGADLGGQVEQRGTDDGVRDPSSEEAGTDGERLDDVGAHLALPITRSCGPEHL